MSEPIPFLGSKISLISKSEIRYEGILYTIDAQESIIVLTKVQSFGTEDRPAELVVPAKNDIYEYIIFRGTDIKKIEVCDTKPQIPSLHNDPAIVGLQVQQHSAPSIATSYPGASFNHQQPLGAIGSVGNYYSSYSQPIGGQQNLPGSGFSIGVSQPSEFSSGIGTSVGGVSVEAHSPSGNVGVVGGGSGGGNSGGGSSISNQQSLPAPIGATPQSRSQQQQPRPQSQPPQQQQQQQQRDILADVLAGSRSSTPGVSRKSPVADAGVQVSPPPQQQQMDKKRPMQSIQRRQQTPERQSRDGGQGAGGFNRRNQFQNQYGQQGSRYNQGNQGYYHQNMGNQQYQNQYRGGGTGRGRAPRRPQQRGGGRGGTYNQGNRQRQDQQIFEKEFDFEQANEEFEELRHQMANTKISENGPVVERKVDEKKDDSGHETATTGDESEDSSSSSVYYDKTKSFFDSISCEALERSKGKSQRSDWRQERKINVQTFGVATARRGYYPRGGRGSYYNRGGYYRNYGQGYYRGNSGSYRISRGGGGAQGMTHGGLSSRPTGNSYNGDGGGRGGGNSGNSEADNMNHYGAGTTSGASSASASYASAVRSAVTSGPAK